MVFSGFCFLIFVYKVISNDLYRLGQPHLQPNPRSLALQAATRPGPAVETVLHTFNVAEVRIVIVILFQKLSNRADSRGMLLMMVC